MVENVAGIEISQIVRVSVTNALVVQRLSTCSHLKKKPKMTTYLNNYRNGVHIHEMRTPKYILYSSVIQNCRNSSAELDAEFLFLEWFLERWKSCRGWEIELNSWPRKCLLLNNLWARVSEGVGASTKPPQHVELTRLLTRILEAPIWHRWIELPASCCSPHPRSRRPSMVLVKRIKVIRPARERQPIAKLSLD